MPAGTASTTFAIRGDILSTTGYARAARALAGILTEEYHVLGVSIHEDPADQSAVFPGPVLSDADLRKFSRTNPLVVIHHTTPDHFLPVPGAINIGLFYWETDAIPRKLAWPEHIASMDAIWAPTRFVADFVRGCGFEGPIALIPWAQHFNESTPSLRSATADIEFDFVERLRLKSESDASMWRPTSLDRLRSSGAHVFLAIQSLAPRKGLPILINEWCRYLRGAPHSTAVLLLKLNFRHAHDIGADPRQHLLDLLHRYGIPDGEQVSIGLISRVLSDEEMLQLTARASALVTCSYGEGFGGPIVEAINVGTPVIASRHTGIADLLPSEYPLQYDSRLSRVHLRDLVDVYPPSSSWHVPDSGALAKAISNFDALDLAQRVQIVSDARTHAQAFCSVPVVRNLVRNAVERLVWKRKAA